MRQFHIPCFLLFFCISTSTFGQIVNEDNPCYNLYNYSPNPNGWLLKDTLLLIEADTLDGQQDGEQTTFYDLSCNSNPNTWVHKFHRQQIRKGIDNDVPVCNELSYKTVFFDDFNELDTNIWFPHLDNTFPINVIHGLGQTANHKPRLYNLSKKVPRLFRFFFLRKKPKK